MVHEMPTTKPRITITFSHDTYEAIKEFSSLTGMSMSKVVSEMTDQTASSLRSTSALLLRAQNAPKEVMESILNDFEETASLLVELSSKADQRKDSFMRSGDSQPPYINKGVRSPDSNVKPSNNNGLVVKGNFTGKDSK